MQQNGSFKYQQLTIAEERELGRGNYGKVCYALCDDLSCAVKLLNPKIFCFSSSSESADNSSFVERFNQECDFICSMRHPCIVQYLDAYIQLDTGRALLLMELMDESLTSFLDRALSPLPIHIQMDLCYDVVQALAYLHSNGIVHRDLTGKNVLVRGGSHAKVTDFGMMKMVGLQQALNPHLKHLAIPDSSAYMPPEAFRFPPSNSSQIDIFSFGVLCLQIITRQYPQPSPSKVSEIERRKSDIGMVKLEHPLLPLSLSSLKDTDILRPPASQLCRKLKQLRDTPLYEESRLKREEAIQEIDSIRRELGEIQKENDQLVAQLESIRIENEQLSRLISRCSENLSTNVPNGERESMPWSL